MTKVAIKAGAEVEFLTRGELNEELTAFRRSLRREVPTDQDFNAQAVASAAGIADLNFGAPNPSHVWDVRRVTITGQDPTVITACVVRLYKREVGPLTLVDIGVQIPTVAVYSRHEATYKPGENVLVRVSGLTASTAVFGLIQTEETVFGRREEYAI